MITDLLEFLEEDNLVGKIKGDELRRIGLDVVQDYRDDKASRKEWEDQLEEWDKLASQIQEVKNTPWRNASNIKYPLLTEASIQFNARMYPSVITNTVVKTRVLGFDEDGSKISRAIRVALHMNWQINVQQTEWKEDMDGLFMSLSIYGCMFKKLWFNPVEERNVSELVYPQDLVVNYYAPNLAQADRVTHRLMITEEMYKKYVNAGMYAEHELGTASLPEKEPRLKEKPVGKNPHEFLEQHTYLDLDGDGIVEPYIVTVKLSDAYVCRIYPCYSEDDIIANDEGLIINVKKIPYFVRYLFMPSYDGSFYGMGFGKLIGPLNNSVDTTINQLTDAGTMANRGGGWLSRRIRMKRGESQFKPFEWKQTDASGDELSRGIVPLPVREPSNVLFSLLNMMVQSAQRLASTVDSMVGENPGQNQKAGTTMAVIEQGTKIFTGIYSRIYRSLNQELQMLFRLNKDNVESGFYLNIINLSQVQLQQIQQSGLDINRISEEDYNTKNVDVLPAADPKMSTRELQLAKADSLVQTAAAFPQLLDLRAAIQRKLEAEEHPNIEGLWNKEEPQPDPDTVREDALAKHKIEKETIELLHKALEAEQHDIEVSAKVLKDIADAEAAEEGHQLDMYMKILHEMREESKEEVKDLGGTKDVKNMVKGTGNPGATAGSNTGEAGPVR